MVAVVTNTTFNDFAVVGVLLSIRVAVTIYNLAIDVLLSRSHKTKIDFGKCSRI